MKKILFILLIFAFVISGVFAGNVYYAVSAVNRYGESALTVENTPAAVVAGGIICYTIGAKTGKSGSSEGDGVDEISYYDLPPIEETVDNASE